MTRRDVSVAGHFGEWLQGRNGPDGEVVLVTVACEAVEVSTSWSEGEQQIIHAPKVLADFAEALGLIDEWPGLLRTIVPGRGAGASTATLVALAKAHGVPLDAGKLASACVAAEGASDPLMYPEPDHMLWASRRGVVVRDFGVPPRATIVGGFLGQPQRTDPTDCDFPDVADLVAAWARAIDRRQLDEVAEIATTSASRLAAAKGVSEPMDDLVKSLGALGHLRAHTGSARGLIFPPGAPPKHTVAAATEAGLCEAFVFETGQP